MFHGKKGELRQRYREDMEDQLGVLGLVVNAVVLWNTRYLQQALTQWQETEESLNPEDMARLSPLLHEHVNMLEYAGPLRFYAARSHCGRATAPVAHPYPLGSVA